MKNFGHLFLIAMTICIVLWALERARPLQLSYEIYVEHATKTQVYFDTGLGFHETQKREVSVPPKVKKRITLTLPSRTEQIRIDPATSNNTVTVKSVSLKRSNDVVGQVITSDCFVSNQNVQVFSPSAGELRIQAIGADPQLIISRGCVPAQKSSKELKKFIPGMVVLICVGLFLFLVARRVEYRGVFLVQAALLFLILIQLLAIVNLSEFNIHPDEKGHVLASTFYQDHWMKTRADSPEMLRSLIPSWGFSYLYLADVVYFLAEKTTSFLTLFSLDGHTRYRFFNFVLLSMLLATFFRDARNGLFFISAIGLTPQIWYLFSYFNGDGFSLFASLLLCYYFVMKRDPLVDYFWKDSRFNSTVLWFAAMCCLVIVTRLQYAVVVAFCFLLIFILKPGDRRWNHLMPVLGKTLFMSMAILLVVGLFELREQQVNGFEKSQLIANVEKQHVITELSKADILETGNNPYNLYLRDLGVPLVDLLMEHPWLKDSITSLLGVYGYFNFTSSNAFYWISGLCGFGMVIVGLVFLLSHGKAHDRKIVFLSCLAIFWVFFQSLMLSWMVGFQPQGRYLMAVIPIIATCFCLVQKRLPMPLVRGWTLVIYMVNCSGFTLYGVLPMLMI